MKRDTTVSQDVEKNLNLFSKQSNLFSEAVAKVERNF